MWAKAAKALAKYRELVLTGIEDVECPWSTLHCAITSFGPIAQPQRQPVIA